MTALLPGASKNGQFAGAEIDLTIEDDVAPPIALVRDEKIEPASFRSARAEGQTQAGQAEAAPDAKVASLDAPLGLDPALLALIEATPLPQDWSRDDDLGIFELASGGLEIDGVPLHYARPPAFIKARFDQLTGKRACGREFSPKEIFAALAQLCGEAV